MVREHLRRSILRLVVVPLAVGAFASDSTLTPIVGQSPAQTARQSPRKSARWTIPPDLHQYIEADLEEGMSIEDARFRLDRFDLNGDGVQEYFVVGFCSAVGNCDLWVLRKTRQGYAQLLIGPTAQVICTRRTRTNGYLDLEVSRHGSAFDSSVTVYKFDGEKYKEAEGYDLRWEYDDKTGKTRQVEGPRKRPKCDELFTQYVHPVKPPPK
jgi:hypothetical protein